MIKYKKLPENIEDLIPQAVAYLQSMEDINFAYLFGGFGTGKRFPLSEKAETLLIAQTQPAISALTELELFSAISRKVREKGIDHKDAGRVIARFVAYCILPTIFFLTQTTQ